ncbi:hypothetical protein DFH09DRAFT_1099141 [Mycena vulgaris]|nr:hypothetical protein DFH09DRAFT_1099141 [Mycena vulgaris]
MTGGIRASAAGRWLQWSAAPAAEATRGFITPPHRVGSASPSRIIPLLARLRGHRRENSTQNSELNRSEPQLTRVCPKHRHTSPSSTSYRDCLPLKTRSSHIFPSNPRPHDRSRCPAANICRRVGAEHEQRPGDARNRQAATAKSYLPAQDDVQHVMTNAGQAAKAYLPQGVAASDLTPTRPPFATPDRASTNLNTEAQAGSVGPPHLDSSSPSAPNADLGNLSTLVHTGGPASLHPVTPARLALRGEPCHAAESRVSSKFIGCCAAELDDDGHVTRGPDVAAPSPYGVLAPVPPSLNSSAPPDNLRSESHSAPAEPPAHAVDVDAKEGSP